MVKYSFKNLVASAILLVIPLCASAQAPTQTIEQPYESQYGYHPCATEKEADIKACKKGDPCGKACLTAEKKLKKCRIANSLPTHEAGGSQQKPDCTKPEDLPGAPVDATPSGGNPVNPLQSNHF